MEILWLATDTNNHVYLSHDLAGRYSKEMELQFGVVSQEVIVEIDDELPFNTIAISERILQPYNIPVNLPYEVKIDKNKIKIGPVIGIMISFKRFFNQEYVGRMVDYHHIKGLIFICRPKGVNFENRTINGYFYNPSGETKSEKWIEGTFPFPDVIFNRQTKLPTGLYDQFVQYGVEVFNSHYLNKWEQHNVFSENSELESCLPETMKLTKSSLTKMLKKHNEIYVKPITSANGSGIRLISKVGNGYTLIENDSSSRFFEDINALYRAIKRKNYVLQQSVAFKADNRNVDFRVVLQKNVNKSWECTGFVCKVSRENSIITNSQNRHDMLTGEEALATLYHLSPEEAKEKEREMVQLCKGLVKTIEDKGVHLGDVAFDIIIDSNLKLWVLEIQIRYRVFRRKELSSEFAHKSMVTPLYYAKALAGF